MQTDQAMPKPFETYCHQCQSSFAAGTRKCIHCGGRLSPRSYPPLQVPDPRIAHPQQGRGVPSSLPFPVMSDGAEDDGILPRRGTFSPMSVIWLILVLGGAIFQTCSR